MTEPTEPRWLTKEGVIKLHDRSLALQGGAPGLRDEGLLESALARPQNRFAYEGEADLCALAATYAAAISGNHPFADGNKRAAFIAAGVFLAKNGLRLEADDREAIAIVLALAAGEIGAEELADWLRQNVQPEPISRPGRSVGGAV